MQRPMTCSLGAALAVAAGCSSELAPELPEATATAISYSELEVAALRDRAADELVRLSEDAAAQIRANSLEALGRGAPERVRPLIEPALTDSNEGVRAVAAIVAGRVGHRNAIPRLRGLLDEESVWVQMSAIFALWDLGEEVDPTPLARALMSGPPRQRAQAAFLLGEMGNASALPMLSAAASRTIPLANANEVRMFELQVDQARVKLGQPEYVQPIRAALYPTRPEELELTVLAVQLIGELGDHGAAGELINLTARLDGAGNEMPAEVQIAAAGALAKLGNTRGEFLILDHLDSKIAPIRAQAAWALGEIGAPGNLPRLEELLTDESTLVRVHAAGAILRLTPHRNAPVAAEVAETASGQTP
ncbi:MAG: HEAT repeat domain-containing protein [Phycisphaerales bacterium JB039]